jgi:hypothetical protein
MPHPYLYQTPTFEPTWSVLALMFSIIRLQSPILQPMFDKNDIMCRATDINYRTPGMKSPVFWFQCRVLKPEIRAFGLLANDKD